MSEDPSDESGKTPGWDAIDAALRDKYGEQEPKHYAPPVPAAFGGSDRLSGISVFQHPEPAPHWHFVTYGFSELFEKEWESQDVSGFGFELTFRLRTAGFDEPPPTWALNFLQNLARYVFSSGNGFDSGHYMDLNGPIAVDAETKIRAIAFVRDPELGQIETTNGSVDFLQVIGITLDELLAAKTWDTPQFLDTILPLLPLWITDLERASFTENLEIAGKVLSGRRRDGSSTGMIFVGAARWELAEGGRLVLIIGANGVRDFKAVLPGRIPHQQGLNVVSKEGRMTFEPAQECHWQLDNEGALHVHLSARAAEELAETVVAKAGEYFIPSFPQLVFRVIKSEIKDAAGKIVETIG
jgi:hypothetical protein